MPFVNPVKFVMYSYLKPENVVANLCNRQIYCDQDHKTYIMLIFSRIKISIHVSKFNVFYKYLSYKKKDI